MPPDAPIPDGSTNPGARITWALLSGASAALLASSAYRAATLPLTHDESLSYAIFTWVPRWAKTANNHLLNTWLMEFCSSRFGNSELSLRLPSLIAHLIYLACTLWVVKRFRSPWLRIAGFVLFNLNPFLLDFFFLARGYGLGLALTLLSLCLLVRAFEVNPRRRFEVYVFLSSLSGLLAVLANFTFLNYYLPSLLAGAILLIVEPAPFRVRWRRVPVAIALLYVNGALLAFLIPRLLALQKSGELYFGGHVGFVADSVGSLVGATLYLTSASRTTREAISAALIGLFGGLLLLGLYWLAFSLRNGAPLFLLLLLVLAVSVAMPVVEHAFFGSLFPIERAALYYLPIYTIALLWAFHLLDERAAAGWKRMAVSIVPVLLAGAVGWNFWRAFDPGTCYSWWFDMHNDAVLEIIKRDHEGSFPGRIVKLGNDWRMEPSLNFYRGTRGYTWLEPLTRDPVTAQGYDYLYVFESEVGDLQKREYTKLASFPDTKTVLLRVD